MATNEITGDWLKPFIFKLTTTKNSVAAGVLDGQVFLWSGTENRIFLPVLTAFFKR